MPTKPELTTALQEAEGEGLLRTAATEILSALQDLPVWKRSKGVSFQDRNKGGGKALFAVPKGDSLHLYYGAKERRCEVGAAVRMVSEQADNEYNLVVSLRQAIRGPHGGEILAVLQQI